MVGRFLRNMLGGGAAQVSDAVTEVVEVFRPNAERTEARAQALILAAQAQQAAEFSATKGSVPDQIVNLMNRLPRPILALGTVGLFVYAMVDPVGFTARMVGLAAVPEPLWWLLGAVVTFYFGARELHYTRRDRVDHLASAVQAARSVHAAQTALAGPHLPSPPAHEGRGNPALDEMLAR